MRPRWETSSVIAIVGVWLALACIRLDLPGLQFDEVGYAVALYPNEADAARSLTERLMLMPYMGALMGWVYRIWFAILPVTPWTARLPMVLLSALTLLLIYRTLHRILPTKAALAVLVLAASDPGYLLTSRHDWGPVVLQRLCFWSALAVLAGGVTTRRALAAGVFCGVGLFDKLSFHWLIVATVLTALALYRERLTIRPAVVGLAGFLMGSLPVWLYRLAGHRSDPVQFESSWQAVTEKLTIIGNALTGRPLNGWIAHSYLEPEVIEQFAPGAWFGLADLAGSALWIVWIATAVLLLIQPDRHKRLAVASLLFCGLVAVQMIAIQGAGYLHHWALVAPIPLIAIGLLAAGRTKFRWLVLAVLFVNLLSIARQYAEIIHYGGRPTWSEAVYDLSAQLQQRAPEQVIVIDWGIEFQLRLLSEGKLNTRGVYRDEDLRHWLSAPGDRLFVAFATGASDLFESAQPRLESAAADMGLQIEPIAVIHDQQGRPIYQLSQAPSQ